MGGQTADSSRMYLSPSQVRHSQSSMHVCDMQSTRFVILRGRTKRSFEQMRTWRGCTTKEDVDG